MSKKPNLGATQPRGLDTFFIGNSEEFVNVIFNCVLSDLKLAPIHWINNMVIRGNLENMSDCSTNDILRADAQKKYEPAKVLAKSVMKVINDFYSPVKGVEKWLLAIVRNIPLNSQGCPNKYPKNITKKTFEKELTKISLNQIFIEYDIRILNRVNSVHKIENLYINLIEDAFEKNRLVTIYNTFNNKLPEIKRVAKRKKISIIEGDGFIKMKFYDFRKLGITYDLTDFF
jgi:hypothetical protein